MSVRQSVTVDRLPVLLWPLGAAAELAAFLFLFRGSGDVTTVDVINRAVGGSFIACGLVAWQRRPANRTGKLMTLVGFLFLAEPLLVEVDSAPAYTLGQVAANWWSIPFAALVLAFPSGRIASRLDAAIVAGFAFGTVILQLVWVLFLEFPAGRSNVLLVSADAGAADAIDTFQRWFVVVVALALVAVGVDRWLRAPPPLRRLLLPTLAGALAMLILAVLVVYQLVVGEPSRVSRTAFGLTLVAVPLAFLFGLLRTQLARGHVADLVVALRRTPESGLLGDVLAKALRARRSFSPTGCRASSATSTPTAGRSPSRQTVPIGRRRSSTMTSSASPRSSTTRRWHTSPTSSSSSAPPPTSLSSRSVSRRS